MEGVVIVDAYVLASDLRLFVNLPTSAGLRLFILRLAL